MNRRTFFKRIAVTCAAAVVAPVVLMKAKKKQQKPIITSVLLGRASSNYPKGEPLYATGVKKYIPWFPKEDGGMFVYCAKPIRKGQALIWNSNGTIEGM